MFQAIQMTTSFTVLPVVQLLPNLIALTFWWPSPNTDGKGTVNYVHKQNEGKYYEDIFSIASLFINRSPEFRALCPLVNLALDKPTHTDYLSCTNTLNCFIEMHFSYPIRLLKLFINHWRVL